MQENLPSHTSSAHKKLKPEALLTAFREELFSQGKSQSTVDSYSRDVSRFFSFVQKEKINWTEFEPSTLSRYTAFLEQTEKTNTIRRAIIGIRQYFRFFAGAANWTESPFEANSIPRRDERLNHQLEEKEIKELMQLAEASSNSCKGARDAAIIALFAYEGIKVHEMIEIGWSDFIYSGGLGSLRITGQRTRIIQLCRSSSEKICLYKNKMESTYPKQDWAELYQKIFIGFRGRNTVHPAPKVSRHGLKFMLYEVGIAQGNSKLNSESLRHHAINYHLSLGRTATEIMQHFGLRRVGNIKKHLLKQLTQKEELETKEKL